MKAENRCCDVLATAQPRAPGAMDPADAVAATEPAAMPRRDLLVELRRYIVVGGLAFVVDWAVLRLGIDLGAHYLLATALGFAAGLVLNYALSVTWVWRGTRATAWRDFAVFTLIGIGGLLLTEGLMHLAVETGGLTATVAKPPIAGLVLLWNFGLRRIFVFFR